MSHHREIIRTSNAPAAIGAYNQAVVAGNMVFVSGQLGLDPQTGNMAEGGFKAELQQCLKNMFAILEAAGCGAGDVVSCTVYMADLNDFKDLNEIYGSYFPSDPPSRAAIEVSRLPRDGRVEISCIAVKPH